MEDQSVTVQEIKVPVEAVRQLSPEHRYAYYLLGLIHNESMMLRKLISFSLPRRRDNRDFKRGPEMAQTLFLFRIGCCKLWEARLKLESPQVRSALDDVIYVAWPDGREEMKALRRGMQEAHWLNSLRNEIGFHYPKFEQWLPFTTPTDTWVHDTVYAGDEPGNQFFEGCEAIVRHQMFNGATGPAPVDQMGRWVEQAVDLLVRLSNFTEHAVWHFTMAKLLVRPVTPKNVGKVRAPRLDDVEIPFWTRPALGRKIRVSR